ncbi:MAG: sulfotransferase domain-containing protein [Nitrospirota bacterium]
MSIDIIHPRQQITCVLGMHRSGTSLIARIINMLGVYLGESDELLGHAYDNQAGFWEYKKFIKINDDILDYFGGKWDSPPEFPSNWERHAAIIELAKDTKKFIGQRFGKFDTWGWKDPRTSLTKPFWHMILPAMRYIICLRNPLDVASSLGKREEFSFEKSINLWLIYLSSVLEHVKNSNFFIISYEDLMENWQQEVQRLSYFLGKNKQFENSAIQNEIGEFIDKKLQHNFTPLTELINNQGLPFETKAFYFVLRIFQSSLASQQNKDISIKNIGDEICALAGYLRKTQTWCDFKSNSKIRKFLDFLKIR